MPPRRTEITFDRVGKAHTNEQKYPFVIELPVAAAGLDVELNGQIIGFHKSRRIPPRLGRTISRDERRYYRWCFADLTTARAFVEQFGGAFSKRRALELPSNEASSPVYPVTIRSAKAPLQAGQNGL